MKSHVIRFKINEEGEMELLCVVWKQSWINKLFGYKDQKGMYVYKKDPVKGWKINASEINGKFIPSEVYFENMERILSEQIKTNE